MKNTAYTISVNGQYELEIDKVTAQQLDIKSQADGSWHILKNKKAYIAKVVSADFANKVIQLNLNGKTFEVSIADDYDRLVKELGLSVVSSVKVNEIKAPMPGLVLDLSVKVGQEVKKGDGLLILEAMKMENVIKSLGDGIVKEILIEKGAAVDKGQLLIQME